MVKKVIMTKMKRISEENVIEWQEGRDTKYKEGARLMKRME